VVRHDGVTKSEIFYYAINLLPAPMWAAWIGAPKSAAARYFASALWPWAILSVIYVVLIFLAMFVFTGPQEADIFSLHGLMLIFTNPVTMLAGWQHYLCFDAFVARWMVNDAPDAGYKLSPVLLLTLFFGPCGMLLYLALRPVLRRA